MEIFRSTLLFEFFSLDSLFGGFFFLQTFFFFSVSFPFNFPPASTSYPRSNVLLTFAFDSVKNSINFYFEFFSNAHPTIFFSSMLFFVFFFSIEPSKEFKINFLLKRLVKFEKLFSYNKRVSKFFFFFCKIGK